MGTVISGGVAQYVGVYDGPSVGDFTSGGIQSCVWSSNGLLLIIVESVVRTEVILEYCRLESGVGSSVVLILGLG